MQLHTGKIRGLEVTLKSFVFVHILDVNERQWAAEIRNLRATYNYPG